MGGDEAYGNMAKRMSYSKLKLLITMSCIFVSTSSNAAWLSVCADQPPISLQEQIPGYRSHVMQLDGKVTILQVGKSIPNENNCQFKEVDLTTTTVKWATLIPTPESNFSHIILQVTTSAGRVDVSEIILPDHELSTSALNNLAQTTDKLLNKEEKNRIHPPKMSWFWLPKSWLETPENIFKQSIDLNLSRVYITVPVKDGHVLNKEELKAFLVSAHQRKLAVWAVIGDPSAVLPEGQQSFNVQAKSYADYNSSVNEVERLGGLQLDIEPYLLPGYQLHPVEWQKRYIDTVHMIHLASPDLLLNLAMPFWWGQDRHGGNQLLNSLADSIDEVTVMDYHTNPTDIKDFAQPFLRWGTKYEKSVSIALENMPIVDEERRVYLQMEQGELWYLRLGSYNVLMLLDKPVPNPNGQALKFSKSFNFNGSSISFNSTPDLLKRLLPDLEIEFMQWKSFSGISLHGLE